MFKLADFGTARELDPGEKFISLHGTEEYLYPGMYERALINPQKKEQFTAKVGQCLTFVHTYIKNFTMFLDLLVKETGSMV